MVRSAVTAGNLCCILCFLQYTLVIMHWRVVAFTIAARRPKRPKIVLANRFFSFFIQWRHAGFISSRQFQSVFKAHLNHLNVLRKCTLTRRIIGTGNTLLQNCVFPFQLLVWCYYFVKGTWARHWDDFNELGERKRLLLSNASCKTSLNKEGKRPTCQNYFSTCWMTGRSSEVDKAPANDSQGTLQNKGRYNINFQQ